MQTDNYWSGSENDANNAWNFNTDNGDQNNDDQNNDDQNNDDKNNDDKNNELFAVAVRSGG